ncbi:hypothetical protein RND81_02G083900 [Saponaria officinalis]|uniref:Peptidase S8/S53 domain-containing protein n=1 Tax=Saponaria officinalis TaxID=3572 RepID=A0AAW1MP12_SAPOF
MCAPGEMIVPLSSPMKAVGENGEERSSMCSLVSGTSFSTALVAGAMAFLKSIHPDWSPAALTSSVMTTADPVKIMCDADMLGIGSGVLNVDKARNPGLVYDIEPLEHIQYLHARKFDFNHLSAKYYATLIDIAKKDKTTIHPRDMNLPILGAAFLEHEKNWTFKRRSKNVGVPSSTYVCHVEKVDGLEIIPQPCELTFENLNEVNGYELQVSVVDWTKGRTYGFRTHVEWRCGNYVVRSPIVILRSSLIKPPEKIKKT